MPLSSPFDTEEDRWRAVQERDRDADGVFVYAVATTGVFCRPTCAARLPRRENVQFFDSLEHAQRSGYRPCKRCAPDRDPRTYADLVQRVCSSFNDVVEVPSLKDMAHAAGMSTFHFHRVFKSVTGLTPRAYFAARRASRMQNELQSAETITEAIYNSGYGASSRFYSESKRRLGMGPAAFRRAGAGETIQFGTAPCSLGYVLIASTERGVCSILLGDDATALEADLRSRFPRAELTAGAEAFSSCVAAAVALVDGEDTSFELPLDIRGTAFQQRVWQALLTVPPGVTTTYSDLAGRIGSPGSVRAVASACAANPIAVAVPCHRVLRKGAALAGYRWGLERKRALLQREASAASNDGPDSSLR